MIPPTPESGEIPCQIALKPPGSSPHPDIGTHPVPFAQAGELRDGGQRSGRGALGRSLALLLVLLLSLGARAFPAAAAPGTSATAAAPLPAVSADFDARVLEVLQRHPEAVFEALQTQLRRLEERKRQAREGALSELQRNPAAAIGKSPTLGQGPVRLIEFSDFQCPYCAAASSTLQAFLAKNSSKVSLIYKFYPLERIHPEALPSARAAWAAQQQGRFWEFHDALFAAQERLGEPLYLEIARNLGMDLKRFNADRQGPASLEAINRDRELADRLGLEGTPFFVVNGEAVSGAVDEAFLKKLVEGR
jgi:protein-disulfide isomerase